jgi:hypothetical protein
MDKEVINPLIEKYVNGTADDGESNLVEKWVRECQDDLFAKIEMARPIFIWYMVD